MSGSGGPRPPNVFSFLNGVFNEPFFQGFSSWGGFDSHFDGRRQVGAKPRDHIPMVVLEGQRASRFRAAP